MNTNKQKWEKLLRVSSVAQSFFPEAVLVGGTAAALHAEHRESYDNDHVLQYMRDHFDEMLAYLESLSNWKTARIKRPVMILGSLDGVETGFRQQIREKPLDVQTVTIDGVHIKVPTPEEMLRVKAYMCLTRNSLRDYIDTAAMIDLLGQERAVDALKSMDDCYPQKNDTPHAVAIQLIKQFSDPAPYDMTEHDLANYKNIKPQYQDWKHISDTIASLSDRMFDNAMMTFAPTFKERLSQWRENKDYSDKPMVDPKK